MAKKNKLIDVDSIDLPMEIVTADDRGCAIVSTVILENQLEILLRKSMLPEHSEPLFGTYGPLSSFAAKIDLAVALALLSAEDAADLHNIRKIRNAFAHQIDSLKFSKPPIVDLIKGIRLRRSTVIGEKSGSRSDFLSAVAIYMGFIQSKVGQVSAPKPVPEIHQTILDYAQKRKK
jgi:DNA-binding MltR family transcriptional regulator